MRPWAPRRGLAQAADLAVHQSGLYAHRECLLISGGPAIVTAGEPVFLALVDIRSAVSADFRSGNRTPVQARLSVDSVKNSPPCRVGNTIDDARSADSADR